MGVGQPHVVDEEAHVHVPDRRLDGAARRGGIPAPRVSCQSMQLKGTAEGSIEGSCLGEQLRAAAEGIC